MRKIFALLLGFMITQVSCQPSREEAIAYNDRIIGLEQALSLKEEQFLATFHDPEINTIHSRYNDYLKTADSCVAVIEGMEEFKGNHSYLASAKKYFSAMKRNADEEYKDALPLLVKDAAEQRKDDESHFQSLMNEVARRSDAALTDLKNEQQAFASQFGFQLK